MRIHKAGHEIRSVDDWFSFAPPKMGKRQWKDTRSAKELAKSWLRKGSPEPPNELIELLEKRFRKEIMFEEAKPECVIKLDDFGGEHRNCDLVVLCQVGTTRTVLNIEAKADEPFSELIGDYYDSMNVTDSEVGEQTSTPKRVSDVPKRIEQLTAAVFGREPGEAIRKLRYQLLHAAAATLIEAKANHAELGLFLIHEFRSKGLNRHRLALNATDWTNFVHAFPELASARIEECQILGPVAVPGGGRVPRDVLLYLGKLVTELV